MPPKVGKNKIQDKNLAFASAKDAAISNASNLINFSFKYLVSDNDKFPCNCWDSEYYIDLFERIRHLCTMRKLDFTSNVNKTLRNHPIKWETTSEPGFGFPMEDQIVDTPYQ
ncbi:MAG TPA: hypothetical protein PLS50_03865, partial [Candidatus Dojkabacteria bacterium]|nr:hypothetical protein [Candidatus Dojkabacteria bacterium]